MKIINTILVAIILTIFYAAQTNAQNSKIDSLDKLINKTVSDTSRVKLILRKLDILSTFNLDSAINLALKTLKEAQNIQFYKGEVDLRVRLVYNYSYKGYFKQAANQLINLEKIIKPAKDSVDFANLYSSWGLLYGMQSKYDSSIIFYKKAIGIYERTGNKRPLGRNYSNIAIGYQQKSNFPMALFYQQKSLKINKELKNGPSQAYSYVNMANTYNNMGDLVRSENNFLKSIELAKKYKLKNVELYAYTNLSTMFMTKGEWQKSYEFAIKAAELGGKMGDQGIQAASLSKASKAMTEMKLPEKAIELSRRAIAIADSSAQPLNINQAYSSMGFVLKSQKKWKEAIPFYERSFEAIKNANLYTAHNSQLFKQLSECYEKTGEYSKALNMYEKYAIIKDSVRSRENIQKATEMTMKYEFGKKEQAAKAEQAAKDEISRTRQIALIIGLILSFLLILGAFIAYYNKRKANALLKQQKDEIESTLTKLRNTQSQLIQSEKMASLGELTAGIAHEIKNPLNFVNNFSEISSELLDEMQIELKNGNNDEVMEIAEDVKHNLEKINQHGKRADSIVKSMLLHSRGSTGKKVLTDLNELLDEYVTLAYHGLRAKNNEFNISIEKNYDKSIEKINIVPQDLSRVFLNIINNACYAANDKKKKMGEDFIPTLKVFTEKLKDKVEIRIKDNGNGIPNEIKNKIFNPFFTTKPTGEGTGLGLSLCHDIVVKQFGGEIKVESKEGIGAEFNIKLPVA